MKTILFVINAPEFFLSHRLPLAIAAREAGYAVHVATSDGVSVQAIRALGFTHHAVPFERKGHNPLQELKTIRSLIRLFRHLRPQLVHLVTIKPVIYGGIAARLSQVPAVVAAVSGLGTVFMAQSLRARIRRALVRRMYGAAFGHRNLTVIFQNPDDRQVLLTLGLLAPEQARLIRGSGVSLADYPCLPEPAGKPVVVMAARLLRDKGVVEFVEAARLLHARGLQVDMRLIGAVDPGNSTTVSEAQVAHWRKEGDVELMGHRTDIARQYAEANIVCLPSYREGLPKALVEAAACGRAVVTTDVAGCRDAITPNVTGLLVPAGNAAALADALQELMEDANGRRAMGQAGRVLAEEAFAINKIVEQHLQIYRELLDSAQGKLPARLESGVS
ncbi:glycosyltransferase family 4 protein [Pseudomonas sp. HR96]|uniref:glycosyltransferase family 4 protein n=1 Tax=Pseudomonas sp. HR96 TaxID=1027966 RepID=UPI002A764E4D|nr:glycosyltransferase family 4 protein [Pseudomonas sp. HR96]WPO98860.1 glycosyltransferase family 4 protein [Pseudomonas sp. HR96]